MNKYKTRNVLGRAEAASFALLLAVTTLFISGGCATQTLSASEQQSATQSSVYGQTVAALNFGEFAETASKAQVDAALLEVGGVLKDQSLVERRAAASLLAMGVIDAGDLQSAQQSKTAAKLEQYVAVTTSGHPALAGRVGDAGLLARLSRPLEYDSLLSATDEIAALGEALSDGVITGYDLRAPGIYDNFPSGETFIYSHSDLLHLRQLVSVMQRERLKAWVYVTPKISAFLYREGWGGSGENLVTLASGVKVVQGREMAVLFRFDKAADRLRFRDLVTRYAKRDSDEETGLIASAWWQPFYYSDQSLADFQPISLVVLSNSQVEATLTVLEPKSADVVSAVEGGPWQLRTDKVWVNPAFHRFLNGGYK